MQLSGSIGSGGQAVRLFRRKKTGVAGLLGVETGPDGIALAQVVRAPGQPPQLLRCEFLEGAPQTHGKTLASMIAKGGLQGARVNLLLHPSQYRNFLLEAPDVPAEELRDAMRWRVKDLLEAPLDDFVVDNLPLPADAYRGRSPMAYCVALAKARMAENEALITGAGLRLQSIDITEMAFRNLGLLVGARDNAGNLALLRLRSSEGLICIQNGADMYMARRIERGLARAEQDLDGMILEIQRSLDYFEGQLGKGHISRLLLLPMKRDGERTFQALVGGLAVKPERLDLRQLFPDQASAELPELAQARCLGAVGAALREDGA